MSFGMVMLPNNLILCHSLLLLHSVFPNIQVFSIESALSIRWPNCWSFSFSISPSNEYSGLISCRIDCFDLLAVQGTLKSLLQHHIQKHQFYGTQSPLWSYCHICKWLLEIPWLWLHGPLMCLLFNTLSRSVIAFLSRSKSLLISWLPSPSAVILKTRKIVCHCFPFSPFYLHEMIGSDAMVLVFWMLNFKPVFSLSSFTLIKKLFSPSSLSTIRLVSSAYLRLLIFLPAFLISTYESFSPAFRSFPGASDSKESACSAGDLSSIPGLRTSAGEENGYPL